MKFNKLTMFTAISSAFALLPVAANAACIAGPEVTVNLGHGASIIFDEPVYQAQLFDVSRLILQPIPEQGTTTLILSQVESQIFPGIPQTPTTSLTAQTENGCYSFKLSYGAGAQHMSVDANPSEIARNSLGAGLLPGGEDIDLATLKSGYDLAVAEHGEDNTFLQRVAQFMALAEQGTSQRLAAQQTEVQWSHLQKLASQGLSHQLLTNSATVEI